MKQHGVKALLATMALVLFPLLIGCTGDYRPASSWEKREFEKADRNIHPNDVRSDPDRYVSTVIAWPGIITSTDVFERPDATVATFVLEHHYFDWLDDSSAQKAHFFLSMQGEGRFRTTWTFRAGLSTAEVLKIAEEAKLLIVYGKPAHIVDGTVIVEASYVRGIKNELYQTNWDYGRPDSPTKR
jgi:hypothetical protein